MKRFFCYSLFSLSVLTGYSQSVKEYMAMGDKQYSKKNYKDAIESFQQALIINPDDATVNFKLGLAYLYSDTKSKAATFIDKAYKLNPNIDKKIDYHLGIAFQNTNNFQSATVHFEAFKKKNPGISSIVDERIAECHMADSLSQFELNVIIENIGNVVNSPLSEYSPIISSDGSTLIFTSNRGEGSKGAHNLEDIYITRKSGTSWSEPKKISTNINNPEYNDAAASLSPDGKTLFLYYEEGGGDIYTSNFDGSDWSKPIPLNKNINTAMFWETCASISPDGKKLYFASNRPDGYGELDIYVSEKDGKGQWGKAFNLGPTVNTPANDDSPYIHYDGVTLYFSSDGHPRLGNSDIFITEFKNGKWNKPENIGYPINSWEYDGFFSISPDKKTAYYATVKEGGFGGADIYSIKFLDPKFKPKPKPIVKVEEVKKPKPVSQDFVDPGILALRAQKVVTVLRGKVIDEVDAKPLAATISLVDNETNKIISKISSDPISGEFELVIPHGGNYGVATEKTGYLFNSINFNLPKFAEFQEIDTHVIMSRAEVGSKVVLKNIFFNVGQSELKAQSVAEVEKILQLLMTNPDLKVQINGHTDNTGNAVSNKALSLKRAKSVVDYIIGKGISEARIFAKGYGSERPIVSNDDEAGGREINRRTEIEIIGAKN